MQSRPAYPPVLSAIGNTPLFPLYFADSGRTIYAKAEFLNPSGSIKDRLALCIVEDAERRGLIGADSLILECTSGNTGIALAMVGAAKGYRVKILMSDTASVERQYLIRQFGGEVQLFKAVRGYATGIEMSLAMAADDPRIFLPRQFENPLNAQDHTEHTGPRFLPRWADGCMRSWRATGPAERLSEWPAPCARSICASALWRWSLRRRRCSPGSVPAVI